MHAAAQVTFGKPMVYSTCSYFLDAIRRCRPGFEIATIAGVRSPVRFCEHLPLPKEIGESQRIPRTFARFLPAAEPFRSAILDITAVARNVQVTRTTVKSYVEILEDTLTPFWPPTFTPRLCVREQEAPGGTGAGCCPTRHTSPGSRASTGGVSGSEV